MLAAQWQEPSCLRLVVVLEESHADHQESLSSAKCTTIVSREQTEQVQSNHAMPVTVLYLENMLLTRPVTGDGLEELQSRLGGG